MTEAASSIAASMTSANEPCIDQQTTTWRSPICIGSTRALRSELDEVEPLISAAVLVATAFRLRDTTAW